MPIVIAAMFMIGFLFGFVLNEDRDAERIRKCQKDNNMYRCEIVAQPAKDTAHDQ